MMLKAVRVRSWLLWQADLYLRSARKIATEHPDWLESREGWAHPEYDYKLRNAYQLYVAAGLGLLAGRVRWLAQRANVVDAWEKFDRLNAGGCGVA